MKVNELTPGVVIECGVFRAMCLAVIPEHPVWSDLSLVVWILDDGRVSFDALRPMRDVGNVAEVFNKEKIRAWLLSYQPEWTAPEPNG